MMMNILKEDVARLLNIPVRTISNHCSDFSGSIITLNEYRSLVEQFGSNSADELCKVAKNVYYDGKGRYLLAIPLLEKAYRLGNKETLFQLSEIYIKGMGVDVNKELGLKYLNEGLKLGNAKVCYLAGSLLLEGKY